MQNVNVTTAATALLAAGNRGNAAVLIQNQSDTTMLLAIGAENVAQLTASLGVKLEAGEAIVIEGESASRAISAIHGGTGDKVAHLQVL